MDAPIPVTVVTGFLGAGKTTLVERWLGELPRDETAVIVNEQGEVGIDGALLASRASRLREITGGCVCCTTQAELSAALAEFAEASPPPTRVLVETSGAASPAGVVRAVTHGRGRGRLRLDGVVTVVDASRADRVLGFDLAIEQLGFADVVVLSHVDQAASVEAFEASVARLAPGAVVACASRGQVQQIDRPELTLQELLDQRADVLRVYPSESRAHEAIDAVSLCHDGELDEARFGEWVEGSLGEAEARILRVKGILALTGVEARVILQGVGEAIEVSLGAPWADGPRRSRLVVLGLGLDADELERGFGACAAGDDPSAREP
jgi:G3E family GTPase